MKMRKRKPKQKQKRKKKQRIVELDTGKLEELLQRVEAELNKEDYELLNRGTGPDHGPGPGAGEGL